MGLFSAIRRKTPNKTVFCGLDSSGKSTIVSFLQEGKFVEHTPTMGKSKRKLEVEGTPITLLDMGGQADFRSMWLGEMKDTKCVVFVLDKADKDRFSEAKTELDKLLPLIKKDGKKLLIFANKHDLPGNASLSEIISEFELASLDNFEIVEISAKTGYGMVNAFLKLYSILTGKVLKKNVVAKAVSIYNTGGVPLVSPQVKTDLGSDANVLEGGFLSAVTTFANMKIQSSSIKFESEEKGTYIVLRSANFIGSLLWNRDLSVNIEESEEALKELLDHLEGIVVDPSCPDGIESYVTDFCSNLM